MNAQTKIDIINPDGETDPRKIKLPAGVEFTRELAMHAEIEAKKTNVAGISIYRRLNIVERTGNARLIIAVTRFADDFALGVEGVRGERLGLGGPTDYASSAGGYTQTQLDALKRWRETTQHLGLIATSLLTEAIIYGKTARKIGIGKEHDHKWVARQVIKAAEKLADHYESPKRPINVMKKFLANAPKV